MPRFLRFSARLALVMAMLSASLAAHAQHAPPSQLQITDQTVGSGLSARSGRELTVNYRAWVYADAAPDHHGVLVDDSYARQQPLTFTLGAPGIIEGWDRGLSGMRVGGKRTLIVPASMAYGGRRVGNVPPHAALVFEIALLRVD